MKATIIKWKERESAAAQEQVGRWFAAALGPLLRCYPEVVCVPVPSPPRNDRIRGRQLLLEMLQSLDVPVHCGLRARRARRDQAGLSRRERFENLQDAFEWEPSGSRPILIVDDVVTSGATISAAANTVISAGGVVRGAFGLARRGPLAPFH